jgi:hypothetical protein
MPTTAKKAPKQEESKKEAAPKPLPPKPRVRVAAPIETDLAQADRIPPPEILGKDAQPIVLHKKTAEKVSITGFAPSKDQAPFDNKEFEIWGCNELYMHTPRIDVLFELHDRGEFEITWRNKDHVKWMKEAKIPIYMAKKYEDIPNCIPYPWGAVVQAFGSYLNNTISEMIALALIMEYKEIHLYGVDMAHHTEYGTQRPSVEYFIGLARGAQAIRGWPVVYIPENCGLLKTPYIYGLEGGSKWAKLFKQHIDSYNMRIGQLSGQELQARDMKNQYLGGKALAEVLMMNHIQG